ncbi:hypothetical protein DFH06DRAFT_1428792 [Mycena polygramma]|nr:hypothetical protein DFH06DRAFT_1428792 [Mycena polygramma]
MSSRTPFTVPQLGAHAPTAQRTFPPIYRNLPHFTAQDPYGLLPLRRRIQVTRSCVLHWCNREKRLKAWEWPVSDSVRVTPSDLSDYRRTHQFRFPCCLCSVHEMDPNHFTEAVVFMVTSGPLSGEFVAACARGVCRYWVLLERMYNKRTQPVGTYPLRDGSPAPTEPLYQGPEDDSLSTPSVASGSSASVSRLLLRRRDSSADTTPVRPPKRLRRNESSSGTTPAVGSSPVNPFIVPYATPEPRPLLTTPFAKLMQLDASNNPGLTAAEFRSLFVCCSACKLYTTTSAFEDHTCRPLFNEVIDLTGDE